ncbi:hypothetical protein EDD16DRAFT_1723281 [Pisolithus croceorrhizus]|nr:hypothetical protein F5141DRAFT_1067284 [Pisolithus sp. B1]KAI6108878.1 hypothetical protein EV401DRAFT_1891744 [Pisolithus croceorrhizus]KAI6130793.1 hypothetical protein EDD16DRAFT_1723281 [Pisolithus croceorrhizus]KAI6140783.1 hypothetical protein EDD17DRAFT_1516284 [Pisolithus thermaeus]
MSGGAVEYGNLAGLLAGDWKDILEPVVTIAESVVMPLLRLDVLLADGLVGSIGSGGIAGGGLAVLAFIVKVFIRTLPASGPGCPASGSSEKKQGRRSCRGWKME